MRQSYPFEAHVRAMIVIALLVVPLCLGSVISADASELRIERPIIGSDISGNTYIEPTGGSKILEAKVYLDSRYVAAGPPYIIPLNTTQLTHGHHRLTVDAFSGPNLGRTSDILAPDFLILSATQHATFQVLTQPVRPTPTPIPVPRASLSPKPTPMPWITRDQDVALQNFNSAITGTFPTITIGGNGTDTLAFIGQANGGLNVSD